MIYDFEARERKDDIKDTVLEYGYQREVGSLRREIGGVVAKQGVAFWAFHNEDDTFPSQSEESIDHAQRNFMLFQGHTMIEASEGETIETIRLTVNTRFPDPEHDDTVHVIAEDLIVDGEGFATKMTSGLTFIRDEAGKFHPLHIPNNQFPLIALRADSPYLYTPGPDPTRIDYMSKVQERDFDITDNGVDILPITREWQDPDDNMVVLRGLDRSDMREVLGEIQQHVRTLRELPPTYKWST